MNAPPEDDVDLVRAAKGGDREAFGELWRRYYKRLYWYCRRLGLRPQDAEDAVMETFTKALANLHKQRNDSGFRSWLYTIARNRCLDDLKRAGRLVPIPDEDGHGG